MFKNLSLRMKLTLAFLGLATLLAGVSCYQVYSIKHFNTLFLNLVDSDFARLNVLDQVRLQSVQLRDQTFEYQQELFENAQIDIPTEKAHLENLAKQLQSATTRYKVMVGTGAASVSQEQITAATSAVNVLIADSRAVVEATGASTNQQTPEMAEEKLNGAQVSLDQALDSVTTAEQKGVGSEDVAVDKAVHTLLTTVIVLTVSITAAAVLLGLLVAAWLSRAINRLKTSAEHIANGDFSQTVVTTSKDELGQLHRAFADMAARLKDSYRRLAIERQRDEAILRSMGDGMIAVDETRKIVLINPVAAELLGIGDQEAMGKTLQDAYHLYPQSSATDKNAKPLSADERPAGLALRTGQDIEDVFIFQRNDGNKFLLNVHASPIALEGQTVGVVTVLRDVTKEKEIDRMKTEFISLASHQLRTPLSAIKWFTEMLVSGDAGQLQPDQLDFAKNIADSTERMISLVNALLNISRIESGRIMIDPKPTDLKDLVTGIINDLKAKTEEKKQTLVVSVHSDLPKINLDPRLIGQVYLNLLTNAIKYTPKGGEINIFISKKDDNIVSQVSDNGYGIPKAQQDRIFQKFFRATNAVKVETDGTGLGLYLIKAVVESSGGKIWFESEENKGTTFWFSIPLSGMKAKKGEVTLDG